MIFDSNKHVLRLELLITHKRWNITKVVFVSKTQTLHESVIFMKIQNRVLLWKLYWSF